MDLPCRICMIHRGYSSCLKVPWYYFTNDLAHLLSNLTDTRDGADFLAAELYTVYDYARCSKHLNLPEEFKQALPVR